MICREARLNLPSVSSGEINEDVIICCLIKACVCHSYSRFEQHCLYTREAVSVCVRLVDESDVPDYFLSQS